MKLWLFFFSKIIAITIFCCFLRLLPTRHQIYECNSKLLEQATESDWWVRARTSSSNWPLVKQNEMKNFDYFIFSSIYYLTYAYSERFKPSVEERLPAEISRIDIDHSTSRHRCRWSLYRTFYYSHSNKIWKFVWDLPVPGPSLQI